MLTSLILASLTWQQIEMNQNLVLNHPIALSEKISLSAGTKTKITDLIPLDEINAVLLKMDITPCDTSIKNEVSEMIIVDDLYGAQLGKNCKLEIYLELGDLNKLSFFSSLSR